MSTKLFIALLLRLSDTKLDNGKKKLKIFLDKHEPRLHNQPTLRKKIEKNFFFSKLYETIYYSIEFFTLVPNIIVSV